MTMSKEKQHHIWREDAKAAAGTARVLVETTAKYVPQTALFAYVFARVLEPIDIRDNAHDVVKGKLVAVTTPFAVFLGLMYQGPLGALTAGIAGAIGTLVAPLRFHKSKDGRHWRLDTLDALFLASYMPILIEVLKGQGIERNAGILGTGIG